MNVDGDVMKDGLRVPNLYIPMADSLNASQLPKEERGNQGTTTKVHRRLTRCQ